MFEVIYTILTMSGETKTFKRLFHDVDIAQSEVTFQKGVTMRGGDKIVDVTMKKVKVRG